MRTLATLSLLFALLATLAAQDIGASDPLNEQITAGDPVVSVNSLASTRNLTLPSSANAKVGDRITVAGAGANVTSGATIAILVGVGDTLNGGSASAAITTAGASILFIYTGHRNWASIQH